MDKFNEKLQQLERLENEGVDAIEKLRRIDWQSGEIQIVEPYEGILPFKDFITKEIPDGKVLDIGCGSGKHALMFAEEGYEAYGFDISGEAIELSKNIAKKRGLSKRAYFLWGDVYNIPLQGNKFNILIDHNLLSHIPLDDWDEYVKNIVRVIEPGGYLCLAELSYKTTECGGFTPTKEKNEFQKGEGIYHFCKEEEIKKFFSEDFQIVEMYNQRDRVKKHVHLIAFLKRKDDGAG